MEYKVEVLLSTMFEDSMDIIDRANIQSDVVVINQCDKNEYKEKKTDYGTVRFFSTTDRGLSRSRNMALALSTGDVCLICDNDVEYMNGYVEIVNKAFIEVPDADVLIFDSLLTTRDGEVKTRGFTKIKKVSRYKTYSSCFIAFKRDKIQFNQIFFNTKFGTGSGIYKMGEEAVFLRECYKKGLKAYTYPAVIHKWDFSETTWFEGYNEKYFNDIGAFVAESYPFLKHFVKWYYPIRLGKEADMSILSMMKFINQGIKSYK